MTKFTRTDRLEAALAVEAGDSIASIARQLGMSRTVVTRSVNLYREQGQQDSSQRRRLATQPPKSWRYWEACTPRVWRMKQRR